MTMLDHALALARSGLPVFPLQPRGKRPLDGLAGGVHAATTDEDQIRRWWTEHPDANIGLSPAPAGLFILDVDEKGRDGSLSLFELEMEHGPLPATLTVRTPTGGRHLYFRGEAPSSAGKLGHGLDVRGRGGYVVAPGSVTEQGAYEMVVAAAPAPAPGWLVAKASKPRIERDDRPATDLDLPHNIERARKWLRTAEPAIEGRGGDNHTFRTAAVVRDFGISEDTCFDLMLQEWNHRCAPPWHPDELSLKVANAYRYAQRAPGAERGDVDGFAAQVPDAPAEGTDVGPSPQAPKSRFSGLSWDEMLGLPEPKWIIDHTLPEKALALVYGPFGTYKSFLVLDMALHAATGRTWLDHPVPRPQRVLYVAGEGAYNMKKRAKAWATHHKLAEIPGFRLVPAMPLFMQEDHLREFAEANKDWRPGIIVVDTVAHAMAGMDENSQRDAGLFIARCIELSRLFDCTVLLVHHTGKDTNKGSRGSTAIPAASDVVFEIGSPRTGTAILTMKRMKDAACWAEPQAFAAKEVAGSLVMEPTDDIPAVIQVQKRLWADVARKCLLDAPDGELPAKTTKLAQWVAAETGANENSIRDWLRRTAGAKGGPLEDCVFERAAGGQATSFARPPRGDTP